ncbi:hypothetical protein ACE3MQ_16540 [Paenibacillus lentus]|uniref:hypothetical protein n=1 Tax=Paenibacillus lentus TaxID=1338368 RepID=UPI0036567799
MWKIQLEDVDIGIRKGNLAPNFTLLDLEGNEVELSDFIGKIGGRFPDNIKYLLTRPLT